MATRSTPAAGASGGSAPLPWTLHVPGFMRLEGLELVSLLQVLRSSLALHVFLILLTQMRFTEGHFLGSIAALMEICTPPKPERGRRVKGPSYDQIRRAIDELESVDLVRRGRDNEAQGQLRLWLSPRLKNKKKSKP